MPSAGLPWPDRFAIVRPECPDCFIPMRLKKIDRHESGNPRLNLEHFECLGCDAVAILPPLFD